MRRAVIAAPVAALLMASSVAEAQTTPLPGTLRYGSGLLEVPAAVVLPHLGVAATWSGFGVDVPARPVVGSDGAVTGREGPWSRWLSDAALAVGVRDRAEVGATFQSFDDAESGGSVAGLFGRFLLLVPERTDGLGLAVGARWLSSPTFRGERARSGRPRPGRLGFADPRLRSAYAGGVEGVATNLSPYIVASATLPGPDPRFVPEHDWTVVVGRGWGMFSEGGHLPWYSFASSNGWFAGAATEFQLRDELFLGVSGEYDGFDVNLGAALEVSGLRVGGFVRGANYGSEVSAYRSRKWGISASVTLCPLEGGLCRSELRDRERPDTIQLPAPPPDTVRIEGSGGASGHVLFEDPVGGVESGQRGTTGGGGVGAGVGSDEVVLVVGGSPPGGDDDDPGVEDADRLRSHELELQLSVRGGPCRLESGLGGGPGLPLPGVGSFDLGLVDPVLGPLEGDAHVASPVGEVLLVEDGEAKARACALLR